MYNTELRLYNTQLRTVWQIVTATPPRCGGRLDGRGPHHRWTANESHDSICAGHSW